jgi:hypothetical protein
VKIALLAAALLAAAPCASAQSAFSARPFVLITGERLAATTTFDAV